MPGKFWIWLIYWFLTGRLQSSHYCETLPARYMHCNPGLVWISLGVMHVWAGKFRFFFYLDFVLVFFEHKVEVSSCRNITDNCAQHQEFDKNQGDTKPIHHIEGKHIFSIKTSIPIWDSFQILGITWFYSENMWEGIPVGHIGSEG